MKLHQIRLSQDTSFGQHTLEGGTVIATISIDHPFVDLSQVLSMVQYRQALIETTEVDDDASVDLVAAPSEASEDDGGEWGEDHDKQELGDSDEDAGAGATSDVPPASPASADPERLESLGLDEGLVEAIKANGIATVSALKEFIDAGNDLVDLDKIGTVRAKKIIAALELRGS